jgi:hypothetical protein
MLTRYLSLVLSASLLAIVLVSCGGAKTGTGGNAAASATASGTGGSTDAGCVPGEQTPCPCSGLGESPTGVRTCDAKGSYGVCVCAEIDCICACVTPVAKGGCADICGDSTSDVYCAGVGAADNSPCAMCLQTKCSFLPFQAELPGCTVITSCAGPGDDCGAERPCCPGTVCASDGGPVGSCVASSPCEPVTCAEAYTSGLAKTGDHLCLPLDDQHYSAVKACGCGACSAACTTNLCTDLGTDAACGACLQQNCAAPVALCASDAGAP